MRLMAMLRLRLPAPTRKFEKSNFFRRQRNRHDCPSNTLHSTLCDATISITQQNTSKLDVYDMTSKKQMFIPPPPPGLPSIAQRAAAIQLASRAHVSKTDKFPPSTKRLVLPDNAGDYDGKAMASEDTKSSPPKEIAVPDAQNATTKIKKHRRLGFLGRKDKVAAK